MKKIGKKKGFTLIELIVVIAILGVLAAIAIPRFSGFTDKAKKQADDQYINIIKNNVTVLLAEGKITALAVGAKITITPADGTLTLTGITGAVDSDFTDLAKATPLKYYTAAAVNLTSMDGTCTTTTTP
jgi:type IV pilus assembly protein PilA